VEGHSEKYLWNVTRRCFTEVFEPEDIVYLTPQSRVPLKEYSHDKVYVFGACVDHRPGFNEIAKVKELGLEHAYFDLHPYFSKKGKMSIPLNHRFRALQDQRDTPNLHYAYRHFARSRFEYRERKMNRILVEDHIWTKPRAIQLPQKHNMDQYEFSADRHFGGWRDEKDAGNYEKDAAKGAGNEGSDAGEDYAGREVDIRAERREAARRGHEYKDRRRSGAHRLDFWRYDEGETLPFPEGEAEPTKEELLENKRLLLHDYGLKSN